MAEHPENVESIVDQALVLESEARARFLDEACLADPSLRNHIQKLIRTMDKESNSFLSKPAADILAQIMRRYDNALPARIGNYLILDELGQGGMGSVYLAVSEQTGRRVALKIVKDGLKHVKARLEAEFQALSRMNHPAVAQVYDFGEDLSGQSFFTLEFFPGKMLHQFCEEESLTLAQRLRLMIRICEGVQHAHQKGVIHRDLKPGNILVALDLDTPIPKIIDFGLARPLEGRKPEDHTRGYEGALGTLAYLAPEQTHGPSTDVDTRTDVYGLGGVLFFLLVGRSPRDSASLKQLPYERLMQHLREEPVPAPSSTLERADWAINPSVVSGELDWIVSKALETNPNRRYATTLALAEDLARFLANEPVLAGPQSKIYRFQKLLYRRRMLLSVSALVLVSFLTAGITGIRAYYQVREAKTYAELQRDLAQDETRKFQTVYKLLSDVLASPDPYSLGKDARVIDLLKKLEIQIDVDLNQQPDQQIPLLLILGETYLGLGDSDRAELIFKNAITTATSSLGAQHQTVHKIRIALARLYLLKGVTSLCTLQLKQIAGIKDTELLFQSERILARCLYEKGQYREAEHSLANLLVREEHYYGSDSIARAPTLDAMALTLQGLGKNEEAISYHSQSLALLLRDLTPGHPRLVSTYNNLGLALFDAGRFEEAATLFQTGLEQATGKLGETHPLVINLVQNLGWLTLETGQYEEAERYLSQAVNAYRTIFLPDNPHALEARNNLARLYLKTGKPGAGVVIFKDLFRLQSEAAGPDDRTALKYGHNYGMALIDAGDPAKASMILESIYQKRRKSQGPVAQTTLNTLFELGRAYLVLKHPKEAVSAFHKTTRALAINFPDALDLKALHQAYLGAALFDSGKQHEGTQMLRRSHALLASRKYTNINQVTGLARDRNMSL